MSDSRFPTDSDRFRRTGAMTGSRFPAYKAGIRTGRTQAGTSQEPSHTQLRSGRSTLPRARGESVDFGQRLDAHQPHPVTTPDLALLLLSASEADRCLGFSVVHRVRNGR
jgi:hypothetical protein